MKKGETSQNRNFRKPSFSKATLVPLKFEVGKILWMKNGIGRETKDLRTLDPPSGTFFILQKQ
jgi:hypothetical protein